MSNFEELQVMYDSFTAKMKEYNIDVTDLDDAVIDRVSASVESPLEELKGTVDRGTEGVRSVVDSAQKVKGETEDSIEEFDNAVDWKAVLLDLPPQLQKLTNLILAGVRDPKMLLPNLSCCAGVPLDLDNITANAVQVYSNVMSSSFSCEVSFCPPPSPPSPRGEAVGIKDLIPPHTTIWTALHLSRRRPPAVPVRRTRTKNAGVKSVSR